jgi:periplasmic divalent cation tolerance protein
MTATLVVLCTCPDSGTAERLAERVVTDGHAACVNVVPKLTSIYRWQGQLQRDHEALMIIKTTGAAYGALEQALREHHPYELPEIIAVPIEQGSKDYLDWVARMTGTTK